MIRHARLIKLGFDTNPIHATKLINQCPLSHAHQVFDNVPHKDTTLWTALISAYSRSEPRHALLLFSRMARQPDSIARPNHFTFTAVARAVASSNENLRIGQMAHAQVLKSGFMCENVVVETAFVDMYAKCGDVGCARNLFDEMLYRNLVTWNAMISGFVQNGMERNGFELFSRMKCLEGIFPDEFAVSALLSGCANVQDLFLGMEIHGYAIIRGLESMCLNPIANMYFSCGEVDSAEKVLSGVEGDIITKMMKLRGYVQNQRYREALHYICLTENAAELFYWDYTVIVPILTACVKLSLLRVGKQVHCLFITMFGSGFCFDFSTEDEAVIGSVLIGMYSKCHDIGGASKVFNIGMGKQGLSHWNSMISGYIYNDLIEDARRFFDGMPEKNVISWTSLMTGYSLNGRHEDVLKLLADMYNGEEGFRAEGNCLTFVVGLEATSHLTDLEKGKQIHAKIMRRFTNADTGNVVVGTALVDMYSKSGRLTCAQTVFDMMVKKNTVAWTSIITAYAVHGFGYHSVNLFKQMIDSGVEPNEVTLIAVLSACSHSGLVDEGLCFFELMRTKYNLIPEEEHLTSIIDMLGRSGRLEEAWHLLEEIEKTGLMCSTGTIWSALLGASYLHGNVETGKRAAKKMLENKVQISATDIALSNVYASAGMWNEAYGVREGLKKKGDADAMPGFSRICTRPGFY